MKNPFRNFLGSLTPGARWFVLAYLLLFPISLAGHYTHTFELRGVLALSPALVWKGQIWRLATYAFLPATPIDWLASSFWLATLAALVGRNWTSRGFWGYCLLGALAGALPVVLLKPGWPGGFVGNAAVIFALLAAWVWFHRRERLLLLGLGEVSVRQAVLLILLINALCLLFSSGWFITLAMWCGGLAGWLWLAVRTRLFLGKSPQSVNSERIARLEL